VKRPEGFDLDAYVREGGFGYRLADEPVRLVALFENRVARHLAETPLSDDQALTTTSDGRTRVEATVADTLELHWWLRGFGSHVEVLEPSALRQEFRDMAEQLASAYGSATQPGVVSKRSDELPTTE